MCTALSLVMIVLHESHYVQVDERSELIDDELML